MPVLSWNGSKYPSFDLLQVLPKLMFVDVVSLSCRKEQLVLTTNHAWFLTLLCSFSSIKKLHDTPVWEQDKTANFKLDKGSGFVNGTITLIREMTENRRCGK